MYNFQVLSIYLNYTLNKTQRKKDEEISNRTPSPPLIFKQMTCWQNIKQNNDFPCVMQVITNAKQVFFRNKIKNI